MNIYLFQLNITFKKINIKFIYTHIFISYMKIQIQQQIEQKKYDTKKNFQQLHLKLLTKYYFKFIRFSHPFISFLSNKMYQIK